MLVLGRAVEVQWPAPLWNTRDNQAGKPLQWHLRDSLRYQRACLARPGAIQCDSHLLGWKGCIKRLAALSLNHIQPVLRLQPL